MRRTVGIIALCAVVALSLSGCMNIQQRAQEVGERLDEAEQSASSAMATAVDNRGLIEALEERIDGLEVEISTLKTQMTKRESSETE